VGKVTFLASIPPMGPPDFIKPDATAPGAASAKLRGRSPGHARISWGIKLPRARRAVIAKICFDAPDRITQPSTIK
jgi:hypothetical protein